MCFMRYIEQKDFNLYLIFSPDVQCDVCRADLPDGSSLFCVWMSRPGLQGTLLQTNQSLQNQSGTSLGEVSGSKDISECFIMSHNISLLHRSGCSAFNSSLFTPF